MAKILSYIPVQPAGVTDPATADTLRRLNASIMAMLPDQQTAMADLDATSVDVVSVWGAALDPDYHGFFLRSTTAAAGTNGKPTYLLVGAAHGASGALWWGGADNCWYLSDAAGVKGAKYFTGPAGDTWTGVWTASGGAGTPTVYARVDAGRNEIRTALNAILAAIRATGQIAT